MQEKAAEEVVGCDGHQPLFVLVSRVAPPERDFAIVHIDEPVIRDRHPVRVASEVAQHVLSSAKRPFAVDDPVFAMCLPDWFTEYLRPAERLEHTVEADVPAPERLLERFGEFGSEDLLEDSDRQ
jgi:hypothetical protein